VSFYTNFGGAIEAGQDAGNAVRLIQGPVGLRMIRLQRWESGPYFIDFSLHIPDMCSFINMREIVKICPRSRRV
jgi:hypothetical protein